MQMELPPIAALGVMSQPRRSILEYIKLQGEARAEDIAGHLGVTVSGIRQQLTALQAEGLIDHEARRGQPGRPRFFFSLAPAGENLFPRAYSGFAHEMLLFLEETEPGALERWYDLRVERRLMRLRPRLAGLTLAEQVSELAESLTREGYMAVSVTDGDGTVSLQQRNCAVLDLARQHSRICENECELIKAAFPNSSVVRTEHVLEGDPRCSYRILPNPARAVAT